MARTAMKRGITTLKTGTNRMKPGRSTTKPTIEESNWMSFLVDHGCVVCVLFHKAKTPCEPHNIVEGGRRLGHLLTIGLCAGHHRNNEPFKIARHVNKARFEQAYGSEYVLLEYLQSKYSQQ